MWNRLNSVFYPNDFAGSDLAKKYKIRLLFYLKRVQNLL
jgi:hypothetical protein